MPGQDPDIIILEALLQHFTANVTMPMTLRHWRFRNARDDELDSLAIRYISTDMPGITSPSSGGNAALSIAEDLVEISIDLVAEFKIPAESGNTDPTGLKTGKAMIRAAKETLFIEGANPTTLGGLLCQINWDGTAPGNEYESPDTGILAERFRLGYRTRSEAPLNILPGD